MCLVSILVPNYNHADYIKQRLDSIYNQTFKDYELIVLDDASTDDSSTIIENSLKGKANTKYLKNQKNSGSTFKQWLKGIECCRGKYIWIAESDDYCDETFLQKTTSLLENDETINCAFVQSIWVDGNNVEFTRAPHEEFQHAARYGSEFVRLKMLDGNYLYNASAILFRKIAFEKQKEELTNLLNNFRYCGDWIFWAYILKDGYVGLIYEYLNYFRRINKGVSEIGQMNSGALEETLIIIQKVIKLFKLKLNRLDYIKISNKIINLWKMTNPQARFSANLLVRKSLKINPIVSAIMIYKMVKFK